MAGVKVCARFRPPNRIEKGKKQDKIVVFCTEDNKGIQVQVGANQKKMFAFDRIFMPGCSQEEVYQYSGAELVDEVMNGFNITMFAYGQTGSGKTFSMEGTEEYPGIIPRMIDHLFDSILDFDEAFEFLVRVTYVEIYNEKIRDLLEPVNSDCKVREHKEKGVYIEDAAKPYVGSPEEVLMMMESGQANRAVTATGMNAESSRSHAVFMCMVEQRNTETDTKKVSKLMLVDLAGSEKVRKSAASGQTLTEAKNINRSLSCLGLVISSLTSGKGHIPYRDSKLTRLLSDSLGGNSKTCIIVTASPCIYNVEETMSTMRFGQNCKRVKNKPKINAELSVAEYKKMVAKLEKKIARQKATIGLLGAQVQALTDAINEAGAPINVEEVLGATVFEEVEEEEAAASSSSSKPSTKVFNIGGSSQDGSAARAAPRATSINAAAAANAAIMGQNNDQLEEMIVELEEAKENLQDELQDARNELEISHSTAQEFQEETNGLRRMLAESEEHRKKLQNQTGQLKFYREKVDFMEKEHRLEIEDYQKRLRDARRKLEEAISVGSSTVTFSTTDAEELDQLDDQIQQDQPVPFEMFEAYKQQQEKKYRSIISKFKEELEEQQNQQMAQNELREIENMNDLSSDERAQQLHKLITENQAIRREMNELRVSNEKYSHNMKAYAQREQYNDKLRRNWQTQLRQMEQALLLSNQINNQNRAKYQQTITEKDTEIAKLRAYVTHQLHRQRTMRRGVKIAKPIGRGKSKAIRPRGNRD